MLTMSLINGPKILLSYFLFFPNMIIYFLKHNVSACHIFFYTDWIDLPIMTFHVHVKYEDIIS